MDWVAAQGAALHIASSGHKAVTGIFLVKLAAITEENRIAQSADDRYVARLAGRASLARTRWVDQVDRDVPGQP
jgi:hypothetical protein